jgi:hypothetical protein
VSAKGADAQEIPRKSGGKDRLLNCGGQNNRSCIIAVLAIHLLSMTIGFSYLALAKMLPYTFFGLTLAIGLSAAQSTTTVSLFLPNTDPQSLVASVIGTVSKQRLSRASFCLPADLNFAGRDRNYLPHLLPTRLR